MKTLCKTIFIALILLNSACTEDDSMDPNLEMEQEMEQEEMVAEATVTSMNPQSGPKTTIVTFTGTDFGNDASTVEVFYDEIAAEVQSVTNTQIVTVVPARAFFGEVRLVINGTEITGFNFDYEIVDVEVSTFAGSGEIGNMDGNGTNATFNQVYDVTIDSAGNYYVADTVNQLIRKISPDGNVTTFAGSGTVGDSDGSGANAEFNNPIALVVDSEGNVFVSDFGNYKIRKITPSGVVSTFAGGEPGFMDGEGQNAQFNRPLGMTIDTQNNLYLADYDNHKIRKITPSGVVSTLAGGDAGFADGNGINAQFTFPGDVTIDSAGNLYIADSNNHSIRKLDTNGNVSTIAGSTTSGFMDGNGANAQFNVPFGISIDGLDNLYISDSGNNAIRKIDTTGFVTTIAGGTEGDTDGSGTNAQFNVPLGMVVDASFTIYVGEVGNYKIRKITQE